MRHAITKGKRPETIATLCSLALCLWGYQTGAWIWAVPMVLLLESRDLIKRRWTVSWDLLKLVHVLAALLWVLAIIYMPPVSPSPLSYSPIYHLIKCLPVGGFPLVFCQTYCTNFGQLYSARFRSLLGPHRQLNLYPSYFGVCLLAASTTGGNHGLFLTVTTLLVGIFLWLLKRPASRSPRRSSPRFSAATFYSLIVLALLLSLLGTQQFHWLQANARFRLPNPFQDWISNISTPPIRLEFPEGELDSEALLEQLERDRNFDSDLNTSSPKQHTAQRPGSTNDRDNEKQVESRGDADAPRISDALRESLPPDTELESRIREQLAEAENESPDLESINDAGATVPNQPPSETQRSDIGNRPPPQKAKDAGRNGQSLSASEEALLSNFLQQSGGIVDPETSQTRIGSIGSLQRSDAILFEVRATQPSGPAFPLYIREAAYNQYRSGTWNAVDSKFVPKKQIRKQAWQLSPQTANTTAVEISTPLLRSKGVLKLPIGTSLVEQLPVDALQMNQYGTVTVRGWPDMLTYTASFDPTQSLASPPTLADRQIPEVEKPTLQKIIKSLNLRGKSETETVQAISAFFREGFQYSLELPPPQPQTTPIAAFLINHRSGHCEYFASATSLLLRAAGIPARYTVGYYVHEYSPTEQQYLVRLRDAHAWVMAYVNGAWITVETTPGEGLSAVNASSTSASEAPAVAEQGDRSFIEQLSDLTENVSEVLSEPTSQSSEDWKALLRLGVLLVVGVAIALFPLLLLVRQLYQKLRSRRSTGIKAKHQAAEIRPNFERIEQRLTAWGLGRHTSETVRQWLLRLGQSLPDICMAELRSIIDLHYRDRFDPQGLTTDEQVQLTLLITTWLAAYPQYPTAIKQSEG